MKHPTQFRAPDMVLRDLGQKLPGSVIRITGAGFPILHYRGKRVVFKQRHGRFEVYVLFTKRK